MEFVRRQLFKSRPLADTSDEDRLAKLQKRLESLILDKYGEESNIPTANILLLGDCGHGKSALVNTLVKAILGEYFHVAEQGAGINPTKTLDLRLNKHLGIEPYMWKYAKSKGTCKNYNGDKFFSLLPHITDFAGLSNEQTNEFQEILQLLILGYIPLGTSIKVVLAQQKKVGIGKLKTIFTEVKPDWRVTHILFVQSCRTTPSTNLAKCLTDALAQPQETGTLTYNGMVHVMMTKYDGINPNALKGDKPAETNKDSCTAEDAAADNDAVTDNDVNVLADNIHFETDKDAETDDSSEIFEDARTGYDVPTDNISVETDEDAETEDEAKLLEKKEADLAYVFVHQGNVKHSKTRWISCCDEVGYDKIQVDIDAIEFLLNLLKHPDPIHNPGIESGVLNLEDNVDSQTGQPNASSWCIIS